MTVKEILGACLEKSAKSNFISNATYTSEQQAIIDRLLSALNTVYREIATEYLPMLTDEEVTLENGKINPSDLSHPALYPVKILDADGIKHAMKCYPAEIRSDFSGEAVLTYAYLPDALALSDSVGDMRLTVNILSDGVLSEFYFTDRVFDLASAYGDKFRTALSVLKLKGREIKIKAGRWGA